MPFFNELFSLCEYRHNTAFYDREKKLDIWDYSLNFYAEKIYVSLIFTIIIFTNIIFRTPVKAILARQIRETNKMFFKCRTTKTIKIKHFFIKGKKILLVTELYGRLSSVHAKKTKKILMLYLSSKDLYIYLQLVSILNPTIQKI